MIDPHRTLSPYPKHIHLLRLAEEERCYCGCMLADYSLGHSEPYDMQRIPSPRRTRRDHYTPPPGPGKEQANELHNQTSAVSDAGLPAGVDVRLDPGCRRKPE